MKGEKNKKEAERRKKIKAKGIEDGEEG